MAIFNNKILNGIDMTTEQIINNLKNNTDRVFIITSTDDNNVDKFLDNHPEIKTEFFYMMRHFKYAEETANALANERTGNFVVYDPLLLDFLQTTVGLDNIFFVDDEINITQIEKVPVIRKSLDYMYLGEALLNYNTK